MAGAPNAPWPPSPAAGYSSLTMGLNVPQNFKPDATCGMKDGSMVPSLSVRTTALGTAVCVVVCHTGTPPDTFNTVLAAPGVRMLDHAPACPISSAPAIAVGSTGWYSASACVRLTAWCP